MTIHLFLGSTILELSGFLFMLKYIFSPLSFSLISHFLVTAGPFLSFSFFSKKGIINIEKGKNRHQA